MLITPLSFLQFLFPSSKQLAKECLPSLPPFTVDLQILIEETYSLLHADPLKHSPCPTNSSRYSTTKNKHLLVSRNKFYPRHSVITSDKDTEVLHTQQSRAHHMLLRFRKHSQNQGSEHLTKKTGPEMNF